uniref:HTH cro/C1-type domain-containing protein n=1 Tax=Brevibacillus choshinensis TaxID=54911 RepID=Q7WSJ5_BRECH|nr:Homolog of unknown protein YycC [Brevibacillus choshinensis]
MVWLRHRLLWQDRLACTILKRLPFSRRKEGDFVRPLQISPETAVKLAEKLNVPLEQLMHMPQHILMQKMMELAKQEEEKETKE